MIFTAPKLMSMCEVAIGHGFTNCDRLRSLANRHMTGRARLLRGDQVFIPPRQERVERGQTEQLHTFQLDLEFLPRIDFIREDGHGYGRNNPPMPAAEQTLRGGNFRPENDPVINELNVSNYVCNRGGNDTVVNNFPLDNPAGFAFHQVGSDDPDHFKVQVNAPRIPDSVTSVQVNLFALKPHYFRQADPNNPGQFFVEHAPTFFTRPDNLNRRMTVECRRIGRTTFFRSAYLRLVTSEVDSANRRTQFLLVSDYFDEPGAPDHERFYIEILHQKVEAEALLRACQRTGRERCGVYKVANINAGETLHIAVHAINDGSTNINEIRAAVYHWTRRVYAQMQIRPVLELVEFRPATTNILAIANANAATAGRHASGRRANGQPSQMTFTVDGNNVTVPLPRGNSPLLTSQAIINAINAVPALAGFSASAFPAARGNFTPIPNRRSTPVDVIVMRAVPAGGGPRQPADVRNAASNDAAVAGGLGGQTLESISSLVDAQNRFPATGGSNGSMQQRALRFTYFTPNCINIYLFNATVIRVIEDGGTADGISPVGNFLGHVGAVGPAVYMRATAAPAAAPVGPFNSSVRRLLVLAHEIGHPLFHSGHIRPPTPLKDAPPPAGFTLTPARAVEIMDPSVDDVDAHDMNRRIADRPIRVRYELFEFFPQVHILDGVTAPARTTPVARFHRVGNFYGIVRANGKVPFDPAASGLPTSPPQPARRRPFGLPADASPIPPSALAPAAL